MASSIHQRKGQSLVEVLVSIAIGALIIGSAVTGVVLSLRSGLQTGKVKTGSFLLQEMMDIVHSVAESDWHDLYEVTKSSHYKLVSTGTPPVFSFEAGEESVGPLEGVTYVRYFTVENVNRNSGGEISTAGTDDPSTQKVTGFVTWPGGTTLTAYEYLTRFRNRTTAVTDWSDSSTYSSQAGLDLTTPGQATLP